MVFLKKLYADMLRMIDLGDSSSHLKPFLLRLLWIKLKENVNLFPFFMETRTIKMNQDID